jgi:dihydroneopterin aldolase
MITIHLNNLLFFAHHGVHEEEAIVGTHFEINADISFQEGEHILSLEDTVNYVKVYNIIKENMMRPARLLETLAMQMAEDIHQGNANIKIINIRISKLNPPINNFTGQVGVTYCKEYL